MGNEGRRRPSVIMEARGLQRYFPVRRGFFQRVRGWIKAVDGVDLTLDQGRTLGLVGESGCGKSTLGRLVLRLLEPDEGTLRFMGRDVGALSPEGLQQYRKQVQMVFQDPFGSLNPRMTAGESVEEGLRILGLSRKERKGRVGELLARVGLSPQSADRYPHEFSGGQRQRIGLARALSVEPSLIVCDEPISALDVSIQAQIITLLQDLQEEYGLTYLFISHDLHVVGYLSDRVAVMYLGKIMEEGAPEELFERPLHPYTQALLQAAPVPDPSHPLEAPPLKGEVPSPMNPPPGCRFQGRCPLVEDRCRQEEIALREVRPGHTVRCWKAS